MTWAQKFGILIFFITAGFTGMEEAGFGFVGVQLGLPLCLVIATVGGAMGGAMIAPTKHWAGLIAGMVAGPCGLLAIYYYVQGRESVWHLELVAVQMIASLPGIGLYFLLRKLTPDRKEWETNTEEQEEIPEEKSA